MATWDDVRRLALALPQSDERLSRGNAQWRVREKLFVWERPLRRSDRAALGDTAPDGPILGAPRRARRREGGAARRRPERLLHDAALRRLPGRARAAGGDRGRGAGGAGRRGVAVPGAETAGGAVPRPGALGSWCSQHGCGRRRPVQTTGGWAHVGIARGPRARGVRRQARIGLAAPLTFVGMVKEAADAEHLLFADGTACERWVEIPLEMIASVEHVGTVPCSDHAHPLARLALKEPSTPEAGVFAALARSRGGKADRSGTRRRRSPDGCTALQWRPVPGGLVYR